MTSRSGRFLVYSSVGDNSDFPRYWLDSEDDRNWDLWVTYYGQREPGRWSEYADRYFTRKGDKFSNFHHIYKEFPAKVQSYEAVMLIDCDIEIGTRDLNDLFAIRESYGLEILQPSFAGDSAASHKITMQIPGAFMHFTDFVEMNTPLFSRRALLRYLDVFDDRLLAWGNDFHYMWANKTRRTDCFAVIDAIGCRNPKPKRNLRECNLLGPESERIAIWEKVAHEKGIRRPRIVTHSVVYPQRIDSCNEGRAERTYGLHAYPVRSGRARIRGTQGSKVLVSRLGELRSYRLNNSAAVVLNLCDGTRTALAITMYLARCFEWSVDEVRENIQDVRSALDILAGYGLVCFHHAAIPVPGELLGGEEADEIVLRVDAVPKSVQVINLASRNDRWRQTRNFLEFSGVTKFSRVAAVAADDYVSVDNMLSDFGQALHERYREISFYDPLSRRFKAKTGCALSHAKAIRNILAGGRKGWHVILEDDNAICYDWNRLVDNLCDTLVARPDADMIILGDRVGIARPTSGIDDRMGTCAYAVRLGACEKILASLDFTAGLFHFDYSLDNHYRDLCTTGVLKVEILENGPWTSNNHGRDSDIEGGP